MMLSVSNQSSPLHYSPARETTGFLVRTSRCCTCFPMIICAGSVTPATVLERFDSVICMYY